MKLNLESVNQLSSLLSVCRAVGIESAVLSDNKFRGINAGKSVCILTDSKIDIENNTLGIGRVNELSKRIELFSGNVNVETTINNRNEISQLMIGAGKSKTNFRCTSEKVIRYPKANEDAAIATITFTRDEIAAITKAADALSALHVIIQCNRSGAVKVECVEESTNDTFSLEIGNAADFVEDAGAFALSFIAKDFKNTTGMAAKSDEQVSMIFGSVSATLVANGHTLVMLSQLTGEEDE